MTSDSSICEMIAFEIQTRDMHTSHKRVVINRWLLSKESRRKIEPKKKPYM